MLKSTGPRSVDDLYDHIEGAAHPESGLPGLWAVFPWSSATETHEKYTCKLRDSGGQGDRCPLP